MAPAAAAVSVYPVPALSRLRSSNVATPAVAVRVTVPESTAPPGFVPSASVTDPLKPVAVFPKASRTVTSTGGVIATPAAPPPGCTVNASTAPDAASTVTDAVFVMATPAAVAVTVLDSATVELRAPCATPLPSVTPPAGCPTVLPLPDAANTTDTPGARLPNASRALTVTVVTLEPVLAVMVAGETVTSDCDADTGPGTIANAAEVSGASAPEAAARVYPTPVRSSIRPGKNAVPLTAATFVIPDSVALPGFLARASVTESAKPSTGLSNASRAWTATTGVIAAPAALDDGCPENTRRVAGPGPTLNAALWVCGSEPAEACRVYPVPLLAMFRSEKVAIPATAVTVSVPPSVAPPGFTPNTTVMLPLKSVAVLP